MFILISQPMRKLIVAAAALALNCKTTSCCSTLKLSEPVEQSALSAVDQLNEEVEARLRRIFGSRCGEIFFHTTPGALPDQPIQFSQTKIGNTRIANVTELECRGDPSSTQTCSVVFNQYDPSGNAINGFSVEVVCVSPQDITAAIRDRLKVNSYVPQLDLSRIVDQRVLLQQ